jgi:hypothetical protein
VEGGEENHKKPQLNAEPTRKNPISETILTPAQLSLFYASQTQNKLIRSRKMYIKDISWPYVDVIQKINKSHPKQKVDWEIDTKLVKAVQELSKIHQVPPDVLAEHLLEEGLNQLCRDGKPVDEKVLRRHILEDHLHFGS